MNELYLKELELEDRNAYISMKENNFRKDPNNSNKRMQYEKYKNMNEEEWTNFVNNYKKHLLYDNGNYYKFFQYYVVENGEFIGSTEIKPELEIMSEEWQKYGGHISYNIVPFKRMRGYGTRVLHLALEKCQELGLKEVMVSCLEDNVGSEKIIQNNYGVLKESIIYEGETLKKYIGSTYKIYNINVDESLEKYQNKQGKSL